MRSRETRGPVERVALVRGLFLLLIVALAARASHLVIEQRGKERGLGQTGQILRLVPARGTIYDRELRELAVTVQSPSVYAIPSEMPDPHVAATALAPVLGRDPVTLEKRLRERRSYTFLNRWVSEETAEQIQKLDLAGVGIVREPQRAYPAGALAGRLLGFTDIDGKGVRGIEQQENSFLSGRNHAVQVVRDARGRFLGEPVRISDTAGGEIALTIDATLQADAEAALMEAVEKAGARGGTVISMVPQTGEILVLAEAPELDPNFFRHVQYKTTGSGAFLDAVEPGSTLKVFLAAGAIEAGTVRADEEIDCSGGEYPVPGKTIRDHRDYGVLNVASVLWHSSNVGAVKIAQGLGPQAHFDTLERFGFGSNTGSGFPFESSGLLRPWKNWQPLDHATIAFGQGISVTPIQLATATAALANDGEWIRPRLIAARRRSEDSWHPTPVERVRRVVSPTTARAVLKMMEGVVGPEGTGRRAGLRDVRVAGKTGTAQKFDSEAGTYSQDRYLAWFIGAVPAEDPRIVIVVVIDEPQGISHGGGDFAAPLFAQIAATHLSSLGIVTAPMPIRAKRAETKIVRSEPKPKPVQPPSVEPQKMADSVALSPKPAIRLGDRLLLPDFTGLSPSEARNLATVNQLELEAEGRGRAVEQAPAPGTIVAGPRPRVRVRFVTATGEG